VANHTFSHTNLAQVDNQRLLNELGQTRRIIRRLTGKDSVLFRPPGGDYTKRTLKVATKAGYHMVLWSVMTKDVSGASIEVMRHRILKTSSDGAIVLMHSGIPTPLKCCRRDRGSSPDGYHFVTVSQLLGFDHSNGGYRPAPLPDRPAYPIASK